MTIKWVPKWDLAKHGARYKTPKNGIENYSKFPKNINDINIILISKDLDIFSKKTSIAVR